MRSWMSDLALVMKWSMRSGTRRTIRKAHSAALRFEGRNDQPTKGGSSMEGRGTDLLADVGVGAAEKLLDLITEVARHLLGGNVGEGAQGEADGVHVGVVHVAGGVRKSARVS